MDNSSPLRKPILLIALAVGVIVAGFALACGGPGGAGPVYLTAAVERGTVLTEVTATGTLSAVGTVRVGSQLSGQIRELFVNFNDVVARGQPLAEIDPQSFAARVREAKAALEIARATVRIQEAAAERAAAEGAHARAALDGAAARLAGAEAAEAAGRRELERRRALHQRGALAESEVERALTAQEAAALRAARAERAVFEAAVLAADAEAKMAAAELENAAAARQRAAALEQAEFELARTVIRAPIDGVVIDRTVDRGQTVAASLEAPTLFTLARGLHAMEVHARIDEADIGRVRLGQRATFTVDAYPERSFEALAVQIRAAPEMVHNVVTYTVLLAADNPELRLLPGMTALARIVVEEAADVLTVPNAALRFRPPEGAAAPGVAAAAEVGAGMPAVVWAVGARGRPTAVPIGIGAADAAASAVVAGPLREGQEVIVGVAAAGDRGPFGGSR